MEALDYENKIPDPSEVSIWPTALRYGFIGGLIGVAYAALLDLIGMGQGSGYEMMTGILSIIITVAVLYIGFKHHRDNDLGGYMRYGRGLGLGAAMGAVMGVLSGIYTAVVGMFRDPEEMLAQIRETYEEQGMEEEAIDMAMSWVETMQSPLILIPSIILGSVFITFLISLIVSAVVKKDPPTFA